jgi:hypothetical protein
MEDIVKHKIRKTTTLVAKVFGKSQSIDHVPAIKYGRANEKTARTLFYIIWVFLAKFQDLFVIHI